MEKKYKTEPEGDMLRIIALKDFSDVKKGDIGGLIQNESNLSQEGDCWVYENAQVWGNGWVFENAKVYGEARINGAARIRGNARVFGNAWIHEFVSVYDNAEVCGNVVVEGYALVGGDAKICERAQISGYYTKISGNAKIYGDARVSHNAQINGDAKICGNARIGENAEISGKAKLWSTSNNSITTLVKNSKDYVILGIERKFCVFSSNLKDISTLEDYISIFDESYIKNIQTIRQLYEKEI